MFIRFKLLLPLVLFVAACGGGGGGGNNSGGGSTPPPPTNNAPVAQAAAYETSDLAVIEDSLAATDADGDSVVYAVATPPGKGSLSSFDADTGDFTYTPDPLADGADSFTFTASDGVQDSSPATVDIEIVSWGPDKQFGSTESDFITTGGIAGTADGGTILGGSSEGPINGSANAGGTDAWLTKFDRRGVEVWTYRVGTADDEFFRTVLADPAGDGVYAILNYSGVGPVGEMNPQSSTVYRIDDNGNLLWSTPIANSSPAYASGYWNSLGTDGDLYVASWVDGIQLSELIKLSGADGSEDFRVVLDSEASNGTDPFIPDSSNVFLRGMDMDAAGNVIVTGSFIDSAARGCDTSCSFIASIDAVGDVVWSRIVTSLTTSCGTTSRPRYYRPTVAADGSIIVVGFSDPFTGSGDGLVVSYNADATAINWSYCDDVAGSDVEFYTPAYEAENGELLVYGLIRQEDDPNTGLPDTDVVLLRLATDGSVVFRREFSGLRGDATGAEMFSGSIHEDPDGVIFISGSIDGELFPGGALGSDDVFYRRLDREGNPPN